MLNKQMLMDGIECDKHNIQQLMDRMQDVKWKGEYRSLGANIKVLVKEIHNAKVLLEHKIWYSDRVVKLPLFDVEPSPVEIIDEYADMDSFFGELE